ncbi:unnamed protein product [Ceutorhynchus assimilis]|uniref:Uncharacterized protein n=1 Tax=Ceutorhynchus assimilis TaxID=467358 RepID=A0A9N9MA75_9CUCU|nr:unnamed protein product [Ceutorhynchus assimilis]
MSRPAIMYYIILFIIILTKKYECFSKTSNNRKIEQISLFLKNNLLVLQHLEDIPTVGILEASENPETDDIINSFLSTTPPAHQSTSFIILNKIPEYQLNGGMTLRLTIVFVDYIEDSVDIVKKVLSCCKTWDIYSKYILIGLNEFDEADTFKSVLKAMWIENKLVNLGIVHIDFSNDLQVVTYNPFKDEIRSLKLSASTTIFPNKLNNLYGHKIKVAYWIVYPYAYKKDGTMRGTEFDFVMTFLKAINATAKLVKKESYGDGCWVTTFLVHPKAVKQINTISDLVESKLELQVVRLWKSMLTTRLQDQYNFTEINYFDSILEGKVKNRSYGVTLDFIKNIPYLRPKMKLDNVYHQVAELIGSGYMVFYLSSGCPYKEVLNKMSLRGLAYGYQSKDWGTINIPNLDTAVVTKLKLSHLHNVFYLWSAGIAISILMFTVELLWDRYRKLL